ncbi:universal stress protein [Thermogymnomonas acidicola]|nr:universal stress protein [Thermogymnomonas acidicola]
MIITGTRKLTGLSRVLLGSVSSELIKVSRIPVLVVPPPPE